MSSPVRNRLTTMAAVVAMACWPVMLRAQQIASSRIISGVVLTAAREAVPNATVKVKCDAGTWQTSTGDDGRFQVESAPGPAKLEVSAQYLAKTELALAAEEPAQNLEIVVQYSIAPVHDSILITASALNPSIDERNDTVYKNTLFSRDDQIFDTLAAGINAGQHEGGGKSLEIRRFGFNLDHGGVNGGLKVLVDDVQQNQSTQGHGQGYLGALKSLTPELVDDVDILNGPFSAEYGDFSGLGVVHIRLKESLPDQLTVRLQGGSFGAYRGFIAYSPELQGADAFLAYEGTHTDGPFINPGRYSRNNITANYTRHLDRSKSLGFKLNFGTNDFYSSGQIPLDLVESGKLPRFGYIDPFDGGRVRLGTFGTYYKKELASGDIFKMDGFLARSLFDLYSNFTFFLHDPIHGDEIQQHDSRLQEGVNTQYLHPYKLFGRSSLLTVGSNFHDNQIDVGLLHTEERKVLSVTTDAHAHVTNVAGYAQQGIDFLQQRLHFDTGLRYDFFRFQVTDLVGASSGARSSGRFQPKLNASFTPSLRVPLSFHASYGRGISSQDARGVVERPSSPPISTTDFLQLGTSSNVRRFSLTTDVFLIDRSNEQVYVPDDGSFEFKGPSRSYGWEAKTSVALTHHSSLNGGYTQVSNAFLRGTFPRAYVDSAPHSVANSGLTLSAFHGFNGSLRYRHIASYILDGSDRRVPRAHGLDVVDLSLSKQIRHGVDLNFAVDNLNNKNYYETQNYLESRVSPDAPIIARVHGTPGSPIGFTVGMTFRLGGK
jgi:outer membrane receptor protein involved in Fe transport